MIDPGNAIMQLVDALDAAKRPADALDTMRGILAECWDDCVMHLPPKLRDADAPNPYRDLTTAEFAALAPHTTPTQHMFVTTATDQEIATIEIIIQALARLDDDVTQQRVMRYITDRTT